MIAQAVLAAFLAAWIGCACPAERAYGAGPLDEAQLIEFNLRLDRHLQGAHSDASVRALHAELTPDQYSQAHAYKWGYQWPGSEEVSNAG